MSPWKGKSFYWVRSWHPMKMVKVGKITLKEAGGKIGVFYRQAKRIRKQVIEKGVKGFIHGNAGRSSLKPKHWDGKAVKASRCSKNLDVSWSSLFESAKHKLVGYVLVRSSSGTTNHGGKAGSFGMAAAFREWNGIAWTIRRGPGLLIFTLSFSCFLHLQLPKVFPSRWPHKEDD